MENQAKVLIEESVESISRLKGVVPEIKAAARLLVATLRAGGKVLICGNGGSAADAQHFAAELVGRFRKERNALAAIALSTDSSVVTSLANDYSFSQIFARQVEALGKPGDILVAISTSGNSPNVMEASRRAREMGIKTMGLLGNAGGQLFKDCDLAVVVPSRDTARIQEGHGVVIHILCRLVEDELFPGDEK